MFSTETYRPDPLVVAGSNWARHQGLSNHHFSTVLVGTGDRAHAHVIRCMFDMNTLVAVVTAKTTGARVEPTSTCATCAPITHWVSYRFTESGRTEGLGDLTLAQAEQTAHNLDRLGDRVCDIEIRDSRGRDVTFEMAAFSNDAPPV